MSHNLLFSTDPNHRWSPRHLQAMSYLYGLYTPDSDQAKVLELGCGMGANLLPFAVAYPNAMATGIDIDGEQIAAGQLHLAQHGIKNITLYTADIGSLLESELEQYDYILIRGLFAQTDLTTRSALLSWCQKHLSPDGIICIGYQTYPGSKITDSLYEAFAFHAAQSEQPEEQVAGIKAMLGFMSEGISSSNPLYQQIKPALNIIEEKSDEQLYIESFAGLHNPCYFIEFSNSLTDTGLCYVGDADAHTEIPAHWGNDTEHLYQIINPQKNKIFGQQYLDLLCGRATRMSLLTHKSHAEKIEFEPNTNKLMDLRWAGYFKRKEVNEHMFTNSFNLSDGYKIQTNNLVSQEVFDTLGWAWPFSIDSSSLLNNTVQDEEILELTDKSIDSLKHSLETIFIQLGHKIHYSLKPTPYDLSTDKEVTWAYKNKLIINSKCINLWHNSFNIKDIDTLHSTNITKQISIENSNLIKKIAALGLGTGDNNAWLSYYLEINNLNESNSSLINDIIPFFFHAFPRLINREVKSYKNKQRKESDLIKIKEIAKLIRVNDTKKSQLLCKELLHESPYLDEIWHELFVLNLNDSTLPSTEAIIKAIETNPFDISYYISLCSGLRKISQHIAKIYPLAKRIAVLSPNDPYIFDILGLNFKNRGETNLAIKFHKKAYDLLPDSPGFSSNLASCYSLLGDNDSALKVYEKTINKKSNKYLFYIYSNYLFSAIHSDIYSPEKLFEIHKEYGTRVTQWAKKQGWQPTHIVDTSANRPLRIGFMSGDLREHAVTKFLMPYWEGLDSNKFELYAYHDHPVEDQVSDRLKLKAKSWLNTQAISHLDLAKRVNADQIDILIDLSGHTAHNRLPVFGLKPAPVQLTWIGYPATTGLEQMDYKIVALGVQNNPIFKPQFTEEFITLRGLGRSFDSSFSVSVNRKSIPALRNGYFTFASFNRPQKISKEVLKTWAEIMKKCPNDKLLIANMPDQEMITNFTSILINYGAKSEQLLFKERVGLSEYLELHNEIDLILDTFPYNGGTTARHAISMGVPTIHIEGKTLVSYTPIYRHYGLLDFQANNVEEYIEKAVAWSKKPDELLTLRKEISEKFQKINTAPIQGKPNNIQVFEKMLKTIFNHYLENKKPASHIITLT